MQSDVHSKFRDALIGYQLDLLGGATADGTLMQATQNALLDLDPLASNYEITIQLHRSMSKWASELPHGARWTDQHLARSYRRSSSCGFMERYEDIRHGYVAHLLPIGVWFSSDPGRAFELSVVAANLVEIDGGICLGTGALGMLAANLCQETPINVAVREVIEFFMCVDWGDDIVGALRYALKTREMDDVDPPHAPFGVGLVFRSVRALLRATSLSQAIADSIAAERPTDEGRVVGVLTSLALGTGSFASVSLSNGRPLRASELS